MDPQSSASCCCPQRVAQPMTQHPPCMYCRTQQRPGTFWRSPACRCTTGRSMLQQVLPLSFASRDACRLSGEMNAAKQMAVYNDYREKIWPGPQLVILDVLHPSSMPDCLYAQRFHQVESVTWAHHLPDAGEQALCQGTAWMQRQRLSSHGLQCLHLRTMQCWLL